MTVKTIIISSIGLLVALLGATVLVTTGVVDSQKNDGLQINLAGRQRMLSQRMAKEALEIPAAGRAEEREGARSRFAATADLFDRTLTSLLHGGSTLGAAGKNVSLPAAEDSAVIEALEMGWRTWTELAPSVATVARDGLEPDDPLFAAALAELLQVNGVLLRQMNSATGAFQAASDGKLAVMRRVQAGAMVLALFAAMGTLLLGKRAIGDPLKEAVVFARRVADGDLGAEIEVRHDNEIGQLTEALRGMTDQLRGTVRRINGAAGTLSGSATSLVQESAELAGLADRVDADLSNVTMSVETMSDSMHATAADSGSVQEMVSAVSVSVEQLSGSIVEISGNTSRTAEVADQAANLAHEAAKEIALLNESAHRIGSVVEIINGIASKTSLLSLNAAIEASSAGEAGRGFAVVANEVKELASQTGKATEEITRQVQEMQQRTSETVEAITRISGIADEVQSNTSTVAAAVEEQSATVHDVFRNIRSSADGVSGVARNVSAATEVASEVALSLNTASGHVRDISRAVSELAGGGGSEDGSEVSAKELAALAGELESVIGWFRA